MKEGDIVAKLTELEERIDHLVEAVAQIIRALEQQDARIGEWDRAS